MNKILKKIYLYLFEEIDITPSPQWEKDKRWLVPLLLVVLAIALVLIGRYGPTRPEYCELPDGTILTRNECVLEFEVP